MKKPTNWSVGRRVTASFGTKFSSTRISVGKIV